MDCEGDTILERIGIYGTKTYTDKPDKCPHCGDEDMIGIEVLGTLQKPLLWQCTECSERYLRLGSSTTEKLLRIVRDTYTNPQDWGEVPRQEFN